MPRTVRERNLESRTARAKLTPSEKPYWRSVDIGLHLGYRKGLRGGRWVMRRYVGGQTYELETIATADDNQVADGKTILSFSQAQKKVLEVAKQYREAGPNASKLTVADAIGAYLSGSRARDQHTRLDKHVLQSDIAKRVVASLTETALASWRKSLASNLGAATRKRITTDFRAVLNSFAKIHRTDLPADIPTIIKNGLASIERVESGARAEQILSDSEIRRLVATAWEVDKAGGWEGDLARLVIVLAATGARFSQVIRMTIADVQESRLMIPVSNKGKGQKSVNRYAVPVGDDVIAALKSATGGRMGHEPLLLRPHWIHLGRGRYKPGERGPWRVASEITPPWNAIRQLAGFPETIIPYSLRHSSIVRALRNGIPAEMVGKLHDTSPAMISSNYAAFIVSALDEVARLAVIQLTSAPVRTLREVTG
jgi:integrase